MTRISFGLLLILLVSANQPVFSKSFCENAKSAVSIAGETEKHLYKTYSEGEDNNDAEKLYVALVRPIDDLQIKKRPLIIGIHGSGFVDSCFLKPCYLKYSEKVLTPYFTPHGYITASVKYRLASPLEFASLKVKDEKVRRLSYQATQDLRDAIKFLFDNADKFGIDTENVFLVGTSAGAISSLHAAFLDNDEAPKDLQEKYGRLAEREKIRGVISLSGAINNLDYLDADENIPLLLIHGNNDGVVPIAQGTYLRLKHLTPVYGGKAVFDKAKNLGIEARGFFYDFGHEIPLKFHKEIFDNVNDFVRLHLTCTGTAKNAK